MAVDLNKTRWTVWAWSHGLRQVSKPCMKILARRVMITNAIREAQPRIEYANYFAGLECQTFKNLMLVYPDELLTDAELLGPPVPLSHLLPRPLEATA